jgi:diacylglycerol kinase family enzyme
MQKYLPSWPTILQMLATKNNSVIVRYVYQAEIEERLLALRIVDDTTSETLFETLCDVLQSNEIDASKIRAQCYDGAPMFLAYEQVSKQE